MSKQSLPTRTNEELLVRIDERTQHILLRVERLEKEVESGVTKTDYKHLVKQVATHEERLDTIEHKIAKAIAFTVGAGFVIGGGLASLLNWVRKELGI